MPARQFPSQTELKCIYLPAFMFFRSEESGGGSGLFYSFYPGLNDRFEQLYLFTIYIKKGIITI